MKTRMNKRTNLAHTGRHARWIVTPTYRSEHGPIVVDHHIEELCDLPDLIEYGPNWNSLVEVKVVLNPLRSTHPGITMEAARKAASLRRVTPFELVARNSPGALSFSAPQCYWQGQAMPDSFREVRRDCVPPTIPAIAKASTTWPSRGPCDGNWRRKPRDRAYAGQLSVEINRPFACASVCDGPERLSLRLQRDHFPDSLLLDLMGTSSPSSPRRNLAARDAAHKRQVVLPIARLPSLHIGSPGEDIAQTVQLG